MPVLSVKGGQGEAKADPEVGEEKAKGGEEMKINREDVVQAALTVERWCREHSHDCKCDCPFRCGAYKVGCMVGVGWPMQWNLEKYLRTRGLKKTEQDVINAARVLKDWCAERLQEHICLCPFADGCYCLLRGNMPAAWTMPKETQYDD